MYILSFFVVILLYLSFFYLEKEMVLMEMERFRIKKLLLFKAHCQWGSFVNPIVLSFYKQNHNMKRNFLYSLYSLHIYLTNTEYG